MALGSSYVMATSRLNELFSKIKDGQVPQQVTQQLLKDWGFRSTADRAYIPLLKSLGFLTADGKPTPRYQDYRDHSRSKNVLGAALRETYGDLFLISNNPSTGNKEAIEGKFKSFHNTSDDTASRMTKTFYALLALADVSEGGKDIPKEKIDKDEDHLHDKKTKKDRSAGSLTDLHYNIQIHLPATKDLEVYNAIFKSLKEHLFDE